MSTYTIPSVTEASKALVASAREALESDASLTVEVALALDTLPKDDGQAAVEAAERALRESKDQRATFARLRFDAVALAYGTGRVGKGRMYAGQRELAKALGMTQGRVSQILTAQKNAEIVRERKTSLRAAAAKGGLDTKTEGLASTIHAVAVDATPAQVRETIEALESGRIPSGPARTMDAEALVKACERILTMSADAIDVNADRDAVERAVKMLTTARANLAHGIRSSVENVSRAADIVG